jgi:hypothetical protein
MTKKDQETILKPLTVLTQNSLDKCNLSDIRKIAKAIDAKILVHRKVFDTKFTLCVPVAIVD